MSNQIQIKSVYGDTMWIKPEELERAKQKGWTLIKTYTKNGKQKFSDRKGNEPILLHVGNIQEAVA